MRPRVLAIDDWVPDPRIGAGAPRALSLLRAIIAAGSPLTLLPTLEDPTGQADPQALLPAAEIALGFGIKRIADFLRERGDDFDVVIVSRPHNMAAFRAAARPETLAATVYDAEALFAAREALQREVIGQPVFAELVARDLADETALAKGTRMVLAVNAETAAAFRAAGHRDVRILGNAATPRPGAAAFQQRNGFLFVGPAYADDTPNADSLIWFVDCVLPKIRKELGRDVPLAVAGLQRAPLVRERAGSFTSLGLVDDLTATYAAARVFVAPTRFAAGLPIKVHDAAAHGLPAVVTPLLAGQLGWRHEREVLVAASPTEFAAQCLRLHGDAALWERLRAGGLKRVARDCDPARFERTVAAMLADAGASVRRSAQAR